MPDRTKLLYAIGDLCRATLVVQLAYDIPLTLGGRTRNKTKLLKASRTQKQCLNHLMTLLGQAKLSKAELDMVQAAYEPCLTEPLDTFIS